MSGKFPPCMWSQMRTTGKQGQVFRFSDTNSQIDYE